MSQSYEEEISLLQAEVEDYKTQLRVVTEERESLRWQVKNLEIHFKLIQDIITSIELP